MDKEPKDLGIKIGSKKEVWWTTVKTKVEESILNSEESLIADREMLKIANRRIDEERKKFK